MAPPALHPDAAVGSRRGPADGAQEAVVGRELITLSTEENKRWQEAFRPLIKAKAVEGDKGGLSATGLLGAYGLLS